MADNAMDFDDLLWNGVKLLEQEPEVLRYYTDRFRYIMVDEYQDTNYLQYKLIRMLASGHGNLCVVGDDDQSIYSWRGADVGNILDFPELFPGTKVVKLEQNYRSCSAILNAANAVISQGGDSRRHTKKLWSALGEGKTPEIITLGNGEDEADFVARLIEQRRRERNCSYNDFAILYRSNQLSRQLEQTLRAAHVPYRMVGGQQFFQRREIKDALAYLRIMSNPDDDQSLLRLLTAPPRGIGAKAVSALKQYRSEGKGSMFEALCDPEFRKGLSKPAAKGAEELTEVYSRFKGVFETAGGLSGKCAEFLKETGYVSGLQKIYKDLDDAIKRRDNIDEFISAISQFDSKRSEPATLSDYLEACSLLEESEREEDDENAPDAVTLTTVHAAKGLEYPVVFVIAMEHGIFPHERALNEGGADEEKRLFYVAVTRAKEELYLLRTRTRLVRGVMHPSRPSGFLGMIDGKYAVSQAPEDVLKTVDADTVAAKFAELYAYLNS
jgi:superfamily I DNA/RNA helicase